MNKEQQKTEKLIVKVISEAQKYHHTLLAQQRVSFVFRYKQLNQSKS